MSVEQEEAWAADANCYVVDEDVDAFGARSSCEMLLTELQVPSPTINHVISFLYDHWTLLVAFSTYPNTPTSSSKLCPTCAQSFSL